VNPLAPIPQGSIIYLTIDNGDGGIAVVLGANNYGYRVYRLPPFDDFIEVYDFECFPYWKPETTS